MSYNASVVPESPSAVLLAGNTGIKLVLLYNTQYNLSTAATLCERNSATTITQLSYGELLVNTGFYRILANWYRKLTLYNNLCDMLLPKVRCKWPIRTTGN